MLLEVGIISEYLSIIFKPGGLNSRNIVIFWLVSLFHEGEVIDGFTHLIDEMFIDILL